tara:strand:+ start:1851 stop:2156 length:306 start_codon:yes stop_codon:yes gene_type:complete
MKEYENSPWFSSLSKKQQEAMIEDVILLGIQQLERESLLLDSIIEEVENTFEWNIKMKCEWNCGSESVRLVKTPNIKHYGKYMCNLCHKYQNWVPYPKENL